MPLIVVLVGTASGCRMMATGQNTHGVRLFQKGDYYAAMEQFQRAMASDPNDANAYYNMASTLHHMGVSSKNQNMLRQAETLYNQCLDRAPDHADCYRGLAVLLVETQRSDRALVLLKNWAIRSPHNADPRIELARLYEESGDKRSAELQLQQAVNLDQTNPRAWAALAYLRESSGDYQQALANYQRAYSLHSFPTAIGNRIASLNRSIGGTTPGQVTPGNAARTVMATTPSARY
jgi:tetratricopeptide (TPR) repeat protein